MKEIKDILKNFEIAEKEGKKTALATVVHVEGSSYRRPGARMLVTEDGQLTGAISGGCLEGDALRKALSAIVQQQNKLITYDTTDEDDAKFGVQLGCNGIVHILFEPIEINNTSNPVQLLRQLVKSRDNAILVTLFSLDQSHQPGTSLLYQAGAIESSLTGTIQEDMINAAREVLKNRYSNFRMCKYGTQQMSAFIEFIAPPVSLIIAGAGNDVQPLVEMASILGWHITVVDGRPAHASHQRFSRADQVFVAKPEEVLQKVRIDDRTFFVLMTHNYNYDLALLRQLITKDCIYIGVLGPKKKLERMMNELNDAGVIVNKKQHSVIYGPVGLDIGAETAEEIGVSIVAEINAVLNRRSGTSLKEKVHSIHGRRPALTGDE